MVKKKASKTKAEDSPQDSSLLDMSNRAVKKMIQRIRLKIMMNYYLKPHHCLFMLLKLMKIILIKKKKL